LSRFNQDGHDCGGGGAYSLPEVDIVKLMLDDIDARNRAGEQAGQKTAAIVSAIETTKP
jgi:hypothetical protein